MKATVDQAACIGCGLCANDCPEVFEMNADKAIVKDFVDLVRKHPEQYGM